MEAKAPDKIYLYRVTSKDHFENDWHEEKASDVKNIPYIRKDKITEILQKQIDELVECHSFELSYELREVLDNINEI